MAETTGKGKNKKHGRDKIKCAKYKAMHTREMNKVRRMLQSNGRGPASVWATANNVLGYLHSLDRWKRGS